MCCGTEAGSYLRLIDSCITQLKDQGPSRTCNESKEEEEVYGFGSEQVTTFLSELDTVKDARREADTKGHLKMPLVQKCI